MICVFLEEINSCAKIQLIDHYVPIVIPSEKDVIVDWMWLQQGENLMS